MLIILGEPAPSDNVFYWMLMLIVDPIPMKIVRTYFLQELAHVIV
jgi:hypothetical protein